MEANILIGFLSALVLYTLTYIIVLSFLEELERIVGSKKEDYEMSISKLQE